MNIVLIGYRCTGKTSVGRMLASRLGKTFRDSDCIIQEKTGREIRDIVATEGWPAFRAEEKKAIGEIAKEKEAVIALGGGAVLDHGNVEILKKNGLFIWLTADEKTIISRMGKDAATAAQRPPLQDCSSAAEVRSVLAEREPTYRAAADYTIDTVQNDPEKVVDRICKYFEGMKR
ncbi:MAG: shikimate kinase [Syntrophales bacterium]|nr:shikimate kinase [Syntrophales bacterium]